MKRHTSLLGIVLFTLVWSLSSSALAADTALVKVNRIVPWTSMIQVEISQSVSCGGSSTNQIEFDSGKSNADHILDIAMAALLAGKDVKIRYDCNGTDAVGNTIRVYR